MHWHICWITMETISARLAEMTKSLPEKGRGVINTTAANPQYKERQP